MQARALILRGNRIDSARAADYLQLAIKLDPKFAPAYARLAQVRTFQYETRVLRPEQAIVEARQAAQKAIELDPSLSAAIFRWPGSTISSGTGSPQRPKSSGRASSILGDADALRWAGISARALGHLTESISLFQQAVNLDPLNGANYAMLSEADLAGGEFAAAELASRKAIELAPPNGFGARAGLGATLVAGGRACGGTCGVRTA